MWQPSIRDFTPLHSGELEVLDGTIESPLYDDAPCTSLEPLSECVQLHTLHLLGHRLSSFHPLCSCVKLEHIQLPLVPGCDSVSCFNLCVPGVLGVRAVGLALLSCE
jgi:hypothetical protein